MFDRDDSFIDPSLCDEESSDRGYFHAGSNLSMANNPCADEFSFKLNHSQQICDKLQTDYQSTNSTKSLRQNLEMMEKDDIIQLLLEEVKYTQQFRQKNKETKNEKQIYGQVIEKSNNNPSQFINFKIKYEELVKDFEEYISNTREAQRHFIKTIEELKKQKRDLLISFNNKKHENSNNKYLDPSSSNPQLSNKEKNGLVQKLENTIEKYLEINNELIGKIEKLERIKHEDNEQIANLKKAVQKLQFQCDTLDKENENLLNENYNFKNIIEELKLYIKEKRQAKDMLNSSEGFLISEGMQYNMISQRNKNLKSNRHSDLVLKVPQINQKQNCSVKGEITSSSNLHKPNPFQSNSQFQQVSYQQIFTHENLKAIQIQNRDLKSMNLKLEAIIEKKSEKIRTLLDEVELMSEEKLMMNREILKLTNSSKESIKVSDVKESRNQISNTIDGQKMVSSSIYSLKNSQSTCLETSKGPRNDENKKQDAVQKRSAIRQAYNNCFKKQSENNSIGKEDSQFKIKSEANKIESSYMPRVLNFSNKKSSDEEKLMIMLVNSPKSDVY